MNRAEILAGKGLQVREVELPGLGQCHIKDLPYAVWRDKVEPKLSNEISDGVRILVQVVTDPDGNRIFNDDDVDGLCAALSLSDLIALQESMLDHLGLSDKAFDGAKKN